MKYPALARVPSSVARPCAEIGSRALAPGVVEPFARRQWSGLLISWSRLVAGRTRDPLVGRDLLIGALLSSARLPLADALGITGVTPPNPLSHPLARSFLGFGGVVLAGATSGLFTAFVDLMSIVLARLAVRKPLPALAVYWLVKVLTVPGRTGVALTIVRFGFLAYATAGLVGLSLEVSTSS